MYINSESICSVLVELSGVDISVGVIEGALALCHSISPVTVVLGSILPELLALTVLDVNFFLGFSVEDKLHLAGVGGALAHWEIFFEIDLLTVYFFYVISVCCFEGHLIVRIRT